ncbi:oligopeptide transporter 5-like [Musa acuminata AAA Group]|uniref:oligopeptide transporter 5-like n=1 Tax=Musa acuminata AAA Group TaxID=214697 RepID=UPI0031CE7250
MILFQFLPPSPLLSGSILDDSPIEQVRLTVPPTDDNTLQVLTFRTWLIGIPICIFGSVSAALSFYRQQMFNFSHVCINMMVFIAGKLMANMLPNKVIRMPYTNWSFSLNPGPFNLKEHVATTMLAGRVSASAGFEILTISKIFYHKDIPLLPAILLVLSIQFLGYGFAGIFMKLLVHSPYMWWPSTLVDVAFYRALHEPKKRAKGKLSRYQFFIIVIVVIFTYSIVPVYLFPSITALSFVCWIWKDSITAQQIGSGFNGLGIGSFALDWMTMTSYMDSPLAVPAFVVVNMMAGFILIIYVLVPLSYWNNAYDAKCFPIFSSSIFDIDGQFYNVSRVLDEKSLTFNEEAYNNYSKLYFSASLMYSYGFTMACFTSSISHVALFYGR